MSLKKKKVPAYASAQLGMQAQVDEANSADLPTSGEIRVVLPMDGWGELEYLADDLPNRFVLAHRAIHPTWDEDHLSCEGEEEGDVWVFYCYGLTAKELLTVVEEAIPDDWKAAPEADQIVISRR